MITKLNKLSLKNNFIETLWETEDFIFSIVFCKETNGIFYSNCSRNNISMFNFIGNSIVLYKEEDIKFPKNICLNENHQKFFYQDNNNGISGFYIKNGLLFSWTNYYSKLTIESQQNAKNMEFSSFFDINTKSNYIEYIDDLNKIFISQPSKNFISFVDDSGKIYKFIGSGKPDFCSSTNFLNVSFNSPTGVCFVNFLEELLVGDTNNHVIRRFLKNKNWIESLPIGIPTKEGEQDGNCSQAMFKFPSEICNFEKNIFIIDNGNKIRKIDINKNAVLTVYSTTNFIKSITCDQDNVYWIEMFNDG